MPPDLKDTVPLQSTPQQQSWGAIIAMVVILAMIIIGAFYSWNNRTHTEKVGTDAQTGTTTTQGTVK